MKRVLTLLLFCLTLFGSQAFADSILFVNPTSYYVYGTPAAPGYGGYYYQDGFSYLRNGGYARYNLDGNVGWNYAYLDFSRYQPFGKAGSYFVSRVDGSIFDMSFNQKTDVLSGLFTGYEEKWSSNGGMTDIYVNGARFTDNFNTGRMSIFTKGHGHGGGTSTPEPGTLALLGTGLLAIAGSSKRHLLAKFFS